jgi:hypothetical protein
VRACRLAVDFRYEWGADVVINLVRRTDGTLTVILFVRSIHLHMHSRSSNSGLVVQALKPNDCNFRFCVNYEWFKGQ